MSNAGIIAIDVYFPVLPSLSNGGFSMVLINNFKKMLISLYQSIRRFPLTLILSSAVTILVITIAEYSHQENNALIEMLGRIAMVLALGIPLSLIIKFIIERFEKINTPLKLLIYILSTIFLFGYYLIFLPGYDMVPLTRYTALSLAFYLAALLIPYFYLREGFELYIIRLILRFFTTIVFSLVLQLGISAILFTIDKLLGIPVYEGLYLYIWFTICGVFASAFFLAGIPGFHQEMESSDYPGIFKVLLLYIIMPLITAYTIIMYLYFGKVLITFKWPVGLVGHLVLWYSVICICVIFLVYTIQNNSKWAESFIFWLPKLILPLILMMFVSLGIRIRAYGITENRYFVLALGLWVIGVMLYWNISKYIRNTILPFSLAIIMFLSVTGPWSAYSTSIGSQNNRLGRILSRNNMLKEGSVITPSSTVTSEDKKEINAILRYFITSHSLKEVKYLPQGFTLADMNKLFGFEYEEYYNAPQDIKYFAYSLNYSSSPHSIRGYDYLFNFRYPGNAQDLSNIKVKADYNSNTMVFKLYNNGTEVYAKSMPDFTDTLYGKYGTTSDKTIPPEAMTFVDENAAVKVKFLFINIYGSRDTTGNVTRIDSMEFNFLLDIKGE